ncbi:MAG: murein biosynthesis integral membrane protein MurJ [Spirochaetales bacterium]|uniref:Probable lipid II flippase MurJ n=1 Tax=Candidatus Thalassospirochaeta sargassi TaxID=3119039 RepID=A0AAJ1MIT3_9SPIO|nr:murein biosynthesis integral membrane protein MurJ [Spirochaetales bacterium]
MMAKQNTSRTAFTVMVCTLISRILGFVRIGVITAVFGAGGKADVINLTFSIPNNLRKLSAEGALSSAFIPVLSRTIAAEKNGVKSKKIVRNLIGFQLLLLVPLSVICIIFSEPLIRVVLAEFNEPWQIELSSGLFRWFINYLLFISISAVIIGALNSSGHFLIPAITPILFSICVISSILLLHQSIGPYSMAVGVVAGGLAQILFQLPKFSKYGFDLKPDFSLRNEEFRQIVRQWLPVLATSSILTITQTIAFRFASGLAEGSTSALTYAIVYWQFPYGIFSASISTVLFPKMAKQIAVDDGEGLLDTIQYGIRYLAVLLIPSAIFLSMYGHEIISVTLQRGHFSAENTSMTARVLTAYSLGLFSTGAYNFLQRYFYSGGNYRTPFIVTSVVAVIDVALSLWLKETFLGVGGLAIANSAAFTAGLVVLLILVRRREGRFHGRRILITFCKIILAMIPFIIFLNILRNFTGNWWVSGSSLKNLILLACGFTGSCILILSMYKFLKIEMLDDILRRGRKKA